MDDVDDICDWLLGSDDDEAAELNDSVGRMQRRKMETGAPAATSAAAALPRMSSAPPTSVFLATTMATPSRASFDAPRPQRASCDMQRPPRASFDAARPPPASFDAPRAPLPTVPEGGDRAGVLSWLAGWGKLAEEQGCGADTPCSSSDAPQQRAPMAAPPPLHHARPSRPAAMAAGSALFSISCVSSGGQAGASGSPPASPFKAAAFLAPMAQQPQQHMADWSSESSDNSFSRLHSDTSAHRCSVDEQSSSWSSWLASGATSHHVRSPTPVPARASMDGWADSGCCAAFDTLGFG
ncbi:hypothetical protein CHLNCDRAFT_143083 [Chlorella variabilis]|uniref:Uncharacterized protein n=1 Tax=Chlorella variabilis TaxID=554065 RepID=E1Z9F0_CHLVA|nr:hypothetical protein CHLNCDRAFT_143083 [Chlorella variabilis]EFN57506.1 hypothetical protein CHLNCDRAFT_143083 [Chlorella variabilis]|eukprot:XP_005849608.1 hypothetical protein CHLNCDRAFT_143083 [Chlorella variabilis]